MIIKATQLTQTNQTQSSESSASLDTVKILHLINGEHFSGAERVQDLLAMAMPQFGYETGFACVKPDKFPGVRESQDCELFETKMNSKFDIFCARRVAKVFATTTTKSYTHTPLGLY